MKMNVLIVDDEPLARDRLRDLLARWPDVHVLGEAGDGQSALEAIERLRPDVVFLDVQMPELDGFGVVESLPEETRPVIVFVTAYDQFAVRAFEVHALDYILKPFDAERLQQALKRAEERLQRGQATDLHDRLKAMLAEMRPEERAPARLAVKTSGKVVFLNLKDIDWIEAADNYVILHVGAASHMHRDTMTSMEARLPSETFMRISRSTLVNIERIKEVQPLFHGDYVVILRDGTKLTLSRTHRDKLNRLLGKKS